MANAMDRCSDSVVSGCRTIVGIVQRRLSKATSSRIDSKPAADSLLVFGPMPTLSRKPIATRRCMPSTVTTHGFPAVYTA